MLIGYGLDWILDIVLESGYDIHMGQKMIGYAND